jgi:hypothetical protein
MLNLEKARKELANKSYGEIQAETAWTWASRACVAYQNINERDVGSDRLVAWSVAEELYHESVEHAALANVEGLLGKIREAVKPFQDAASKKIVDGLDT